MTAYLRTRERVYLYTQYLNWPSFFKIEESERYFIYSKNMKKTHQNTKPTPLMQAIYLFG